MKLHISMQVEKDDFAKSVTFYSSLFGVDPAITKDHYAKWDVQDPSVNFVVEALGNRPHVDHFGIQVETKQELQALAKRLSETGHPFLDIEEGTCCYANLEKAWVLGPIDDKWEAFLTHSHSEEGYGEDREHLLTAMKASQAST